MNISIREEASILYNTTMLEIKQTKKQFKEIVKTINADANLRNSFTSLMNLHLQCLIEMWRNNKNANIEYYFMLKKHHSHINGHIEDPSLKKMWDDYIKSCCFFRCSLLKLNDLCSTLQSSDDK